MRPFARKTSESLLNNCGCECDPWSVRCAARSSIPTPSAARRIVSVLTEAFDIEPERVSSLELETVSSLANPIFTHYVVLDDGVPAAVARRATFDGASYLSSIGTAGWARHRGFGGLVTASAAADAAREGSEWTYLGVFADNPAAIRVYERLGFERVGESSPDMLLPG